MVYAEASSDRSVLICSRKTVSGCVSAFVRVPPINPTLSARPSLYLTFSARCGEREFRHDWRAVATTACYCTLRVRSVECETEPAVTVTVTV